MPGRTQVRPQSFKSLLVLDMCRLVLSLLPILNPLHCAVGLLAGSKFRFTIKRAMASVAKHTEPIRSGT